MTADHHAVSLDDDESAIEAMEHRDRRCRAVGHVEAQLRRIREGYNATDDSIAIRHALRAEDDPPVPRLVRQFAEQIVDYSIGSPFAPADPTDDLPPSLRSVDDVRRVCEAAGLDRDSDGDDCWGDGIARVEVARASDAAWLIWISSDRTGPTANVYPSQPSYLLLAAIRSAREETP